MYLYIALRRVRMSVKLCPWLNFEIENESTTLVYLFFVAQIMQIVHINILTSFLTKRSVYLYVALIGPSWS